MKYLRIYVVYKKRTYTSDIAINNLILTFNRNESLTRKGEFVHNRIIYFDKDQTFQIRRGRNRWYQFNYKTLICGSDMLEVRHFCLRLQDKYVYFSPYCNEKIRSLYLSKIPEMINEFFKFADDAVKFQQSEKYSQMISDIHKYDITDTRRNVLRISDYFMKYFLELFKSYEEYTANRDRINICAPEDIV